MRQLNAADIAARRSNVRFTPESGHSPPRPGCLLWATTQQAVSLTRLSRLITRYRRDPRKELQAAGLSAEYLGE